MTQTLAPGESRSIPAPGKTVTLKTPLKTRVGNILAAAGTYDILEAEEYMGYDNVQRTALLILSTTYYGDGTMPVQFVPRKADKIA